MGGLVARSFIVNYGPQFPYVRLFISLALPWGGDRMAEYGVKQSPVVIPSWIDMQPEGDFIKSLYRTKMPDTISFYMFYGYRGSRNPFLSNNDGTITLSSLLDYRPQSEAEMNYAFNLDFVFMPDGVIRGCVAAALKPEDEFVGRPDYRYRSIDTKIHIQSITLKGRDTYRRLQPLRGPENNHLDFLIRRDDFCYNNCFGFFGLPAGDDTLTIKAQGYKAIHKKYSVIPGTPEYFRVTELTPD